VNQIKPPNFHDNCKFDPDVDLSDVRFTFLFYNYAVSSTIMVPVGYLKDVLGHTPSMTALTVAAILQRYRCDVDIIDAALNEWDCEAAIEELKRRNPDVVGLTVCSADFNVTSRKWIRKIKESLGCTIVVGGELATGYPAELLEAEPAIDFVCAGQADHSLGPLLRAWRDGAPMDGIAGIAYRDAQGRPVFTGPARPMENLDAFPHLPYHLQEYERYMTPQARHRNYSGILTSRGCPYACRFCYERAAPYSAMSPARVVDEMAWAHKEFDIREFDFWDPTFNISHKRAMGICEEIVRRRLKITFSIRARPDLMTTELLEALKKAGCYLIQYGIESGDTDVINAMDKRGRFDDLMHTERIIKRTRNLGMETAGYLVAGLKYQTPESVDETVRFLAKLKLDYTISLPAYIGPVTPDYEAWKREMAEDFWGDYIRSGDDDLEHLVATAPQYFPFEQRLEFVKRYIRTIYFQPRQILKVLFHDIRYPASLWSKIRAGQRIILMAIVDGLRKRFAAIRQ